MQGVVAVENESTEIEERFPEQLRKARMRLVYSQQQLADLTGGICSRRTIQNYERGTTAPRMGSPQLHALATVLRVEPGDLLYGEEHDA